MGRGGARGSGPQRTRVRCLTRSHSHSPRLRGQGTRRDRTDRSPAPGAAVVGGSGAGGGGGGAGGVLATTKLTVVSGSTQAPALWDCEITVSAGYWSVDLYLVVASSPRSATICSASARVMPTSVGTSTLSGSGCRLGLRVLLGRIGWRGLVITRRVGWAGAGGGRWGGGRPIVDGGAVGNDPRGDQEDDADGGGEQDAATALGLRPGRGGAGSPLADRVVAGCGCAPGAGRWGHQARRGWFVEGGVGDVDMCSAPLPVVPARRAGTRTRPRAAPPHPIALGRWRRRSPLLGVGGPAARPRRPWRAAAQPR